MLKLSASGKFKRDLKICQKRNYNFQLLDNVIAILKIPEKLPEKYQDHDLKGNYKGYRECHIQPNWLLIYKIHQDELILNRTGTHSDLFQKIISKFSLIFLISFPNGLSQKIELFLFPFSGTLTYKENKVISAYKTILVLD